MKRVVGGKVYDTETAILIESYDNGHDQSDFNWVEEDLYVTTKDNFFLHGRGGGLSDYTTRTPDGFTDGSRIVPLSHDEVIEWLEKAELSPDVVAEYLTFEMA